MHFIGDVHQPLHAADRNGDGGGNAEIVTFFGKNAPLHTIWDNQIVYNVDSTNTVLAADLSAEIATAAGESATSAPMDWALQSYQYAIDVAYSGIPGANSKTPVAVLGQPYQDAATPVVRIQIAALV